MKKFKVTKIDTRRTSIDIALFSSNLFAEHVAPNLFKHLKRSRNVFGTLPNIKMELFAKYVQGWNSLTNFTKNSILDAGFWTHFCLSTFPTVSSILSTYSRGKLSPPRPDLGRNEKLTYVFIFTLLCGASKGFM